MNLKVYFYFLLLIGNHDFKMKTHIFAGVYK